MTGGEELFIIGKNFLKDTKVIFMQFASNNERTSNGNPKLIWEQVVAPDKEYLQQTHLICVVPPYANESVQEPVNVQICVTSSNKKSDAHNFVYIPLVDQLKQQQHQQREKNNNNSMDNFNYPPVSINQSQDQQKEVVGKQENVLMHWNEQKSGDGIFKMPDAVPLNQETIKEPSLDLKAEFIDENSMNSTGAGDNSMDGSSPTVSTTSNALVPAPVSSQTLQNFPLPSMMEVSHPFVQQPPQNSVELMQQQNFKVIDLRIKNEEELSPHHQHPQNFFVQTGNMFQNTQQMFQPQQQIIENSGQNQMMGQLMETNAVSDIILNSQSAVVLANQAGIQKQQDQPMPEAPGTNMIMNPTIQPSMMCQNDQNLMGSVPMDTNPMMNMNGMIPLDSVNVPAVAPQDSAVLTTESIATHHPATPPVAVKNMILNAAAEILTSQEPSAEAQSTINALMMHTMNQPEPQPCLEVQQTQQTMMYSTEMPPPPIPPAPQNNQMTDLNLSLIAHKMNQVVKSDAGR